MDDVTQLTPNLTILDPLNPVNNIGKSAFNFG